MSTRPGASSRQVLGGSVRAADQVVAEAAAAGRIPGRRTTRVVSQELLNDHQGIYRLVLSDSYTAAHAEPAQFVNLYPANSQMLLPRPFGVAGVHGQDVELIYQIVGAGTEEFSHLVSGDSIDMMGPLGTPFDVSGRADYVLVGGGLGIPPLLYTAQLLAERDDVQVTTAFGYRDGHFAQETAARYVPPERMHAISDAQGNVVDLLNDIEDGLGDADLPPVILSCGPMPMMRAVAKWAARRGMACQLSLEARMGCGYGACVACVVDTPQGRLKVCKDGPVFTSERLGWNV
ncbi:dihydroorotate dehydrogenase electron transfer subunit [Bifidobacterium bombi]